ncbi:MAG: DUF86 domain-containing protein [Anaerolineae bacterium]|nr:DUF86 domain-containing protein [Anaerolineae bacterium]MDQ7033637.1 DUF86 domain-containing protein [Anaerolineae bacterium]
MSKTTRGYLQDLSTYLDKVSTFTQSGRDAFYANEMAQLAVIRCYTVIGEIVKRLSPELRDTNPQIGWRKLAGFRDFLAHNYDEIILDFVWQAIEDLPALRAKIQALLNSLLDENDEDSDDT